MQTPNTYERNGNYSISADRRHIWDGATRIWDERRNAYLTDPFGEVLTFPLPYDAQVWLEQAWLESVGIESVA